jgi:hypothetical protein
LTANSQPDIEQPDQRLCKLLNKFRGVPRVNDRRAFTGIFWILRSGALSRDLLKVFWALHNLPQPLRSLASG